MEGQLHERGCKRSLRTNRDEAAPAEHPCSLRSRPKHRGHPSSAGPDVAKHDEAAMRLHPAALRKAVPGLVHGLQGPAAHKAWVLGRRPAKPETVMHPLPNRLRAPNSKPQIGSVRFNSAPN